MKWVLIFGIGMALFITYSILLWCDGYNDGMLKERRDKIRSWTYYNSAIRELQMDLNLIRADLDDIKKKDAAEKKPLTFDHDPTGEPIGRVVNKEVVGDGLRFTIKNTED